MKPVTLFLLSALLFWFNAAGCTTEEIKNDNQPGMDHEEMIAGEEFTLLPPELQGQLSVEEAIYARISRRTFGVESLTLFQVGQLLWSAGGLGVDGITGASRTAPSAGATYPLDLYLVAGEVEKLPAGVFRYNCRTHSLEALHREDKRAELARAALGQEMISRAQNRRHTWLPLCRRYGH